MGIHRSTSAIQINHTTHAPTYSLDGNSWQHVSDPNQPDEACYNSPPGWEFMAARQRSKSTRRSMLQLTDWMGIHGGTSAIQINQTKQDTTHTLDGNS